MHMYELTVKRVLANGDTAVWATSRVNLLHTPFERIEFPNRADDQLVTSVSSGTVYVMNSQGKTIMTHDFPPPTDRKATET